MTDTFHSLTVILDREVREDDAEFIINAIKMIKGVASVRGNVTDGNHYAAKQMALIELRKQMEAVLYPK